MVLFPLSPPREKEPLSGRHGLCNSLKIQLGKRILPYWGLGNSRHLPSYLRDFSLCKNATHGRAPCAWVLSRSDRGSSLPKYRISPHKIQYSPYLFSPRERVMVIVGVVLSGITSLLPPSLCQIFPSFPWQRDFYVLFENGSPHRSFWMRGLCSYFYVRVLLFSPPSEAP